MRRRPDDLAGGAGALGAGLDERRADPLAIQPLEAQRAEVRLSTSDSPVTDADRTGFLAPPGPGVRAEEAGPGKPAWSYATFTGKPLVRGAPL